MSANRIKYLAGHRIFWRLLSLAIVCSLWEWAGRIPISPAFPPFSETARAMWVMLADGTLFSTYAITLQPLVLGVLICGVGGVILGIAMGLSNSFEWFTLPIFIIVQAAPMAAIIPLITFLYGIGLASKVLAVVMMATPIVVLNSYRGIRTVNPSLIQMCRSFMGNRWDEILKIIIPDASGLIFTGLRLGVATGFIGVVLAELLITPTGIGDLITYYRSIADYASMFASIVSILVFAAAAVTGLQRLETILFPAKRHA
jgi:ABC-type nitrate/sulfonate/bicarbonate transport system permease component